MKTPLLLEDGKFYMIDIDYANGGPVKLLSHGKHFCEVEDPDNGERWTTMVYRLSELINSEPKQG